MVKHSDHLIESYGAIGDVNDPLSDVIFWQNVSTEEKFKAAWELIQYYYHLKGRDNELRFFRSIETIGQMEGSIRDHRSIRRNGVHRAKGNKRS